MNYTNEELEILKQDFKGWLVHPLTKIFIEILSVQRKQALSAANDLSYSEYYKKEKNEVTTSLYGKADGLETAMNIVTDCKENESHIETIFNQTFEIK